MISTLINCTRLALIFLASSVLTNQELYADNWPQWRGPTNNGISTESNIATTWTATENVRWRTALPGQGGATPIVWNDRIFLTTANGDDLELMCLHVADGKILWSKKVTSGNQNARAGEGNSASPSPSTDGQHVWCFFSTGVLACYDLEGNEVWKFDTNERFGEIDIQFGMTSTPVLHADALYLQLIHGAMKRDIDTRTGKVIKLDKLTGKTIWEVDRPTEAFYECKHSYASPTIAAIDGQEILVVHGAECTTGHSLDNGKEIWRLDELNGTSKLNAAKRDDTFRFVASPVFTQQMLVVPTCKRGPTVAVDLKSNLKGSVNQSEAIQWVNPETPDVSIPLVVDDLVYLLMSDGKLQCLEKATGKQVYLERTHSVQHRTSPVYADGKIYFFAKDGVCTVVKAGRDFEILASNNIGMEPITASPVIANGVLYVRSYNAIYAVADK